MRDECSSGTTGTDTLEGNDDDDGDGGADDEDVIRNHLDIK